jgi:fatty acid desaturase
MASPSLADADLKEHLQRLRRTDNLTNWYYLARTYLFLAVVIGAAVWFELYRQEQGWSVWWSVLVYLPAIVCVGAGQHQLSGLAHEGSHSILFKNRYLNELVSDWFCLFPLFSSTYHYRLQHVSHHQFVNDPERDPDVAQLKTSGHWLGFPLGRGAFLKMLLRQLWIPNLIRFIVVRGKYNSMGVANNPYLLKGVKPSGVAVRIGLAYMLLQIGLLAALVWYGNPLWLAVAPAALFVPAAVTFALLPESRFHRSRLHSVIHQRWMSVLRIAFLTLLFAGLAWITHVTGRWAAGYCLLLWVVPLSTSFSFFMILRQLVQHGNADRGWLTNTRVFFVHHLINFAVFPMGQDYHLPHHLYASVPHYRLKELHELLLAYPEYREQAVVVQGYFLPAHRPPVAPTVLDVLGPDYAARKHREVHIDDSVLDGMEVEEKELILREGQVSRSA